MKATLQTAAALVTELEDALESYQPVDDARAWMQKEAFEVLSRLRGIIDAMTNSEKE